MVALLASQSAREAEGQLRRDCAPGIQWQGSRCRQALGGLGEGLQREEGSRREEHRAASGKAGLGKRSSDQESVIRGLGSASVADGYLRHEACANPNNQLNCAKFSVN